MRINFIVEDLLFFKYVGCATAARMLYTALQRVHGLEVRWNSRERDFDLVHFHTFGPGALLYRRLSGGRKIVTAHSTPRLNRENLALSGFVNLFYPAIYREFDHIIAISGQTMQEAREMAPAVPVTLIPNGIDRERFQKDMEMRRRFRESHGIGMEEKVVLTVAQQTPRKGIFEFIELARRHPSIRWVWVGGFPYGVLSKDYLKIQRSKSQTGRNLIFTGFVPEIREAYSGADVFFLPSHAEGMSIVLLEALSSSLPCVVRDLPEFREVLGGEGLYFGTLEEAGRIISSDEELSGMAARSRDISARFDIREIAARHAALYRELVNS